MTNQKLDRLIEQANAQIPASVTPATRIEIHPSQWIELTAEITQLRGNLSLAEEGLASAMQDAANWQKAAETITDVKNAEIERLQAESDAWDKLSLVQLHQTNERLKDHAEAIRDARERDDWNDLDAAVDALIDAAGIDAPAHEPVEQPSSADYAKALTEIARFADPGLDSTNARFMRQIAKDVLSMPPPAVKSGGGA